MSLTMNGNERDTLILNKKVYQFDHIWSPTDMADANSLIIHRNVYTFDHDWLPINMAGANAQNAMYRGDDLGAFTEDYADNIKNGVFDSMQVGDTFTQNDHTYKIAGFNYLCGADNNSELGNHLIMITDSLGSRVMDSSGTTNGGFTISDMWNFSFPTFVKQLQADFGKHLLTWNELLTTGTDYSGAADQAKFFAVQASMMNTVMYWGSPSQYSTPSEGKNYNIGIENKQLPIMKLHPDEQDGGSNWTWQRDIDNNENFAAVDNVSAPRSYKANGTCDTRIFFLID